jgi:chloramphenicol 3-O phosphotransferase
MAGAAASASARRRGPDVIVLNGISSAGKSTVARTLQALLTQPYLIFGVDTLIDALPPALTTHADGLVSESDGRVQAGAGFTAIEDAWYTGLAATARAGVGLILDEVFLGGSRSQARLRAALEGLHVAWIAVDCDVHVASRRESTRADRTPGMAAAQFRLVHDGVNYDLRVDTSAHSPEACAEQIRVGVARDS